jgi:signal transduction histidine kinase
LEPEINITLIDPILEFGNFLNKSIAQTRFAKASFVHLVNPSVEEILVETNRGGIIFVSSTADKNEHLSIESIKNLSPESTIIAIADCDNSSSIKRAISDGAHENILKNNCDPDTLERIMYQALARNNVSRNSISSASYHSTNEKLIKANNDLKTFIYKASHDLKGPLSSIIGLTNLAQIEVKDQHASEYFEMINECAKKLDVSLVRLIEAMLSRNTVLAYEKICFETLVNDTIKSLKHLKGYDRIRFTLDIDSSIDFYSDPASMSSILKNLIENSIQYQNYNASKNTVSVHVAENNDTVVIQVTDNGIGIDKEIQDKIFDMFYRGNESSSGSGLGLYIAKCAVDKLHGRITLKEQDKPGASFWVMLDKLEEDSF